MPCSLSDDPCPPTNPQSWARQWKPAQAASLAGELRVARPGVAGMVAALGDGVGDDDAEADPSPAAPCSQPPVHPACVRGGRCGAAGSG